MRIVCAADCGVDRFVELGLEQAGGIGLNVAVHLRQLAGPDDVVSVLAPIGDDPESDVVRRAVGRAGLDDQLVRLPGATSVQQIRHPAGADRQFDVFSAGVLAGFSMPVSGRDLIARSDILTTAAFGLGLDLFEAAIECPSRGLRVVDFTNANDIGDPGPFVERHAPLFDIGVFGLTSADGALIDELEAVATRTGRLLVVTLGADGSAALGGPRRIRRAAEPVPRLVDTTGAGDAFLAGFLWSYVRAADVARALEAGHRRASATLSRVGSFAT